MPASKGPLRLYTRAKHELRAEWAEAKEAFLVRNDRQCLSSCGSTNRLAGIEDLGKDT